MHILSLSRRPNRLPVFTLVWVGQFISLLGSGLTEFALGVWVYQQTGSATQFALTFLFLTIPRILLSPFAGALIDRWDRRWTMLLSDLGAGLTLSSFALSIIFAPQGKNDRQKKKSTMLPQAKKNAWAALCPQIAAKRVLHALRHTIRK